MQQGIKQPAEQPTIRFCDRGVGYELFGIVRQNLLIIDGGIFPHHGAVPVAEWLFDGLKRRCDVRRLNDPSKLTYRGPTSALGPVANYLQAGDLFPLLTLSRLSRD